MPTFELTLEGFEFPESLEEPRSTFRFLVDIRYIDMDRKYATAHAVLPGLDTHWECEKKHKDKPNFVRPDDLSAKFDMDKIDVWDRLIIRLRAKDIDSLQVKVIDIEKGGGLLDKVKEYASPLIQSFIGTVKPSIGRVTEAVPTFAQDVLGDAISDVESLALAKLAGMKGEDFLLFKRGKRRGDMPPTGGAFSIEGRGHSGQYRVGLNLRIEEE
ncbi:MAG: hypothetical protein H0W76_21380 [Pyrinomonadaceae bacterium]|nr:hypothetical protein [Pyrinomonadaceae bacterium]